MDNSNYFKESSFKYRTKNIFRFFSRMVKSKSIIFPLLPISCARMWKVYLMKNDLERTCQVITKIIQEGHTTAANTSSFASIAQKYLQPELGTNIAIMECGRGKGIDHVADKMKGKVCYVETKFDGERLQAHYNSDWPDLIKIFSKSGRNSTFNRRLCQQQLLDSFNTLKVKNCILEGELLVFNENSNRIESFGTVQDLGRKEFREYAIIIF